MIPQVFWWSFAVSLPFGFAAGVVIGVIVHRARYW